MAKKQPVDDWVDVESSDQDEWEDVDDSPSSFGNVSSGSSTNSPSSSFLSSVSDYLSPKIPTDPEGIKHREEYQKKWPGMEPLYGPKTEKMLATPLVGEDTTEPDTWMGGFGKGLFNEFISPMTSPRSIAQEVLTGGSAASLARKVPGIKRPGLNSITPTAEAALAPQTAARMLELEQNANKAIKSTPAQQYDPAMPGGIVPEQVQSPKRPTPTRAERSVSRIEDAIPQEMRESFGVADEGITPNASLDSGGASQEALSRQQGMRSRGESFIVYDKNGVGRNLVGPEAVDYTPRPGETYGIKTPRGFVQLENNGGVVPPTTKTINARTRREYPGYQGTSELVGDVSGLRGRLDEATQPSTPDFTGPMDERGINAELERLRAAKSKPSETGIVPEEGVTPAPAVLEPEAQALRDQTQPLVSHESAQATAEQISSSPGQTGTMKLDEILQLEGDDMLIDVERPRIDAIKADIAANGIKEPIELTVSRNKDGPWAGKYLVDEGHHRLAAAKELGLTDVPVRIVGNTKYSAKPKPGATGMANEMNEGRRGTATQGNEPKISTFERKFLQHEPESPSKYGQGPELPAPKKQPVKPEEFSTEIKDLADTLEDVKDMPDIPEKDGIIRKTNNAARSLLTTWDFSAPGRQGKAFLLNKSYWTSLDDMVRAWGSEGAAKNIAESITNHPSGYFKPNFDSKGKSIPSFAERMGLDMSTNEEVFQKTLGEQFKKYSGINKAGRAHTAFLNKLRSDQFVSFMDQAKKVGRPGEDNPLVAKQFAEFINNATGRGSLNVKKWKLERNAGALSDVFFAPKNMSGQIRTWNQVLNPYRYYQADPIIRKQALKSLFAIAGTGMGIGELAKMAGGEVSNDPTSTDFRKIKVGDTRIDLFGGYQQFPVAAMRLLLGKTTNPAGKETDLTSGKFGMPTRQSVAERFFTNRLGPVPAFVWAWMSNKEFDGKPFELKKALYERAFPIAINDMIELAKEDPKLAAILSPLLITGMAGTQTYTRE